MQEQRGGMVRELGEGGGHSVGGGKERWVVTSRERRWTECI